MTKEENNLEIEELAEKLAEIFFKQIELKKFKKKGLEKNNKEKSNENTNIKRKSKWNLCNK